MTQGQRARRLRDLVIEASLSQSCPHCRKLIRRLSLRSAGNAFGLSPARIHAIVRELNRKRDRERAFDRVRRGA